MIPQVTRLQLGSVSVYCAPVPGPTRAALVSRVGIADERPPIAGITHVVEHLALSVFAQQRFEYNGMVGPIHTIVDAIGSQDEVTDFLETFCRTLTALPLDRLEAERRILRDESARNGPGAANYHALLHYGTRGLGSAFGGEVGLRRLGQVEIQEWAREWFNLENVALIWGGAEVPDLQLALPTGTRRLPSVPPDLIERPTWENGAPDEVAVSVVVPRTSAAAMATRILTRRLERRLRYDRGISYAVLASYEPLAKDSALAVTVASVAPNAAREGLDVLALAIRELRATPPGDDEIDADLDMLRRGYADPMAPLHEATRQAVQELLGADADGGDLIERASRVRPTDIRDAFDAVAESVVLTFPQGLEPPDGYAARSDAIAGFPSGRRFKRAVSARSIPRGVDLVVGPHEVGLIARDAGRRLALEEATVAFVDASGPITLVHESGDELVIDPTEWRGGHEAVDLIRKAVSPNVLVPAHCTTGRATTSPARRGLPTMTVWWSLIAGIFELSIGLTLATEPDKIARGAVIDNTALRVAEAAGLLGIVGAILLPIFVFVLHRERSSAPRLGVVVAIASLGSAALTLGVPGAAGVSYVAALVGVYAVQALLRSRHRRPQTEPVDGVVTAANGEP